MQIAQIEAFVEAARLRSISRAAEELYVTQSALTLRIQTLETEVGDDLFTRVKYGVELTDAGRTLLPYAQRVLRTLLEGKEALRDLREATAGTLYLGIEPSIGTHILPRLLKIFVTTHPGVRVVGRYGRSEDVLQMVLDEEVQIGLVGRIEHPEIDWVNLYDDELVLVAHPDHPASLRSCMTLEEVAHEGTVFIDRYAGSHGLVNAVFANAGLTPKAKIEMNLLEPAKKMVEEGLGLSLMPRMAIERELALGTLIVIPITDCPVMRREMVAIYRRGSGLGGIAKAFLDCIKEMYSMCT